MLGAHVSVNALIGLSLSGRPRSSMTKTNTVDVKVLPTGCWRIGAATIGCLHASSRSWNHSAALECSRSGGSGTCL